mgnify:CR=1 FL=1
MRPGTRGHLLVGSAYAGLVLRAPLVGLAQAVATYRANWRARCHPLPLHPAIAAQERVLVIAPHPDDEILATGGLLQRAAAAGARTSVVYLTSGDGFAFAAYSELRGIAGLGRASRLLGVARQREARAALSELGIAPECAHFFGFPDGSLRDIWLSGWDPARPIRSPYTRATHVPYEDARTAGEPHGAPALLGALEAVLRAERPTRIYVPHPLDDHPDHWTAYCYTVAALREAEWALPRPAVYGYLVHRGDWPIPQGGWERLSLAPPAHLIDQPWEALPLTPDERAIKRRALIRHRSQWRCMGRFLRSFLRTNELFVPLSPAPAADASLGLAAGAAPGVFRLRHPRSDAPLRASVPAADLLELAIRREGERLEGVLRLAAPVSRGVTYHVAIHPLRPCEPPLHVTWRLGAWDVPQPTALTPIDERSLELQLRAAALDESRPLLVTTWTQLGPTSIDRITVELAPVRARAAVESPPPSRAAGAD